MTEPKETYTTEPCESAKKKIGTKAFYCCRTGFIFDENEVKECWESAQHKTPYGCCWSCDRSDFAHEVKWNLRGQHMIPLGKDPLLEIHFKEIPNEMKITRTIKKYDD